MLDDTEAGRSGPQGLFAALAQPQLARFPQRLELNPLREGGLFAATFIALSLLLTLAQVRAETNGAIVDLLPSEAVFALLMGAALFPLRLLWLAFGTYAVAFTLSVLLRVWLEPGYLPAGVSVAPMIGFGLVLNAIPALAAGFFGRWLMTTIQERGLPERAGREDKVLLIGTVAAYVLLTAAMVPVVVSALYDPTWTTPLGDSSDLVEAGLFRAARIGLCAMALMLVLLDRPDAKNMAVALAIQPAFILLGILQMKGFAVHPTLDVVMLALAVALLAPAYAAVLANVVGVIVYVAITGQFLVQIPITSPDVLRLEVASVLLMMLVCLLLLLRHGTIVERRQSAETIARLERVQALATVGYFVLDLSSHQVRVDGAAAGILGTAQRFDLSEFLRRVHPHDAATIVKALSNQSMGQRMQTFQLSPGPVWAGEEGARFISLHGWFEQRDAAVYAYGVLIDLTSDHRREVALADALASLSEHQNRQTEIFSIVSHELRTPASVISMLVEELDGGASWEEMGPRMRAVSEQLLSVLADMRQTVRPEENLPVRIETVRPSEIAETVRNTFLLMAEAKGVEIGLDLSPVAWMPRMTDRVRLVQALSNLVKNAILHSECGRIIIGYVEADGPVAVWRVTDDGLGVPEEARAALFEPFRRGDGLSTARTDGSGLGLYVTKSSIELLGGSVEYLPAETGGSVFELRVPMAVPAEAEGMPAPVASTKQPGQRGRILMAEDSELIGELLVARLNRLFEEVVWVKNGADALAAYKIIQPDVVLTDLFMPELGGDDLTSTLRELGADCLIIGMTAAAIGDERTRFEEAGTDLVLTKPVSTRQLLEVLDRLEARARARSMT
ncbi:hypothetical protein C0V75_01970 [Tabrizicola sp. TH137]|uniref:hybrid sensor histidine kinase/response regulator n=1 Tax=Tabrizicola sp. TH137 TaxID=2067452 RepID=UPI000C7B25DE|nr:hybrid sensor histidine kinase/response regulator [Tabrizicola sp. TH137]PLL14237.1 hypothetical protein C0V75_01970 [Tabrizicola sp. TH137]